MKEPNKTCITCENEFHPKYTYYRNNEVCGWCGYLMEYGREAREWQDLIPITRLIIRVDISEGESNGN